MDRAYLLVKTIRDAVTKRLAAAFPSKEAEVDHWLIGRRQDGSNGGSPDERVRLIPLPSIGHHHADHAIRRILVEVPAACPIGAQDVFWAFNGLEIPDTSPAVCLSASTDESMLRHYGLNRKAQTWRTVTPAALPESAKRRRIEPKRRLGEAKNTSERTEEENRARAAVLSALRHAGIRYPATQVHLQREPFESRGERAEAFSSESRFSKKRLWHIAVTFGEPAEGLIVIGDGRFFGLGIMAPVSKLEQCTEQE